MANSCRRYLKFFFCCCKGMKNFEHCARWWRSSTNVKITLFTTITSPCFIIQLRAFRRRPFLRDKYWLVRWLKFAWSEINASVLFSARYYPLGVIAQVNLWREKTFILWGMSHSFFEFLSSNFAIKGGYRRHCLYNDKILNSGEVILRFLLKHLRISRFQFR